MRHILNLICCTMKSVRSFISLYTTCCLVFAALTLGSATAYAHCDSYDGPVIKDAMKALQTNNVMILYKWINPADEAEIAALFDKTYRLRNGDAEIYAIVEKHFLETLVRLHRASEGAPYTGLKPAGQTGAIIVLSDQALADGDIDGLLGKLNAHLSNVIREKYGKVQALSPVKDASPVDGRKFVAAYVDFIHTIDGVHRMIETPVVSNTTGKPVHVCGE